ncbi:two-component system, sensor histidine kinase YesM [Paenibacillus algorifonticola]|uniref:histidine kinase n=1 Tax=Paenibacillus algorifonticola TaxID=684063 RepID=A0A1I2EMA8_9BACL|nr:sensor histidine kinase [Paenibacillus algorifonticola]SFE94214.1 two-component system, sensor histidine kinase YesM [Paenibacillus algorifonticola]
MHQWFKGHLGESNLRTKLLLLFTVLILLPLSLQGIVTYRHFSTTVNHKTEQFTIDIVQQINANLDRLLKDLERLSLMPLYDQMVLSILAKYNGPMGSGTWALSDDYLKMKLYTSGQAYNRPEIRGIHLISNSGILFSNVDAMSADAVWDSRRDTWFSDLNQSDGEWIIIPPHEPSYYSSPSSEPYISVARIIREPKTLARLGYIIIDVKVEAFGQILSNLNFEQEASLLIVDDRQRLIFERVEEGGVSAYGELLKDGQLQELRNRQKKKLGSRDYLFVQHHSSYTGLSVISLTPLAVIQKESREMMTFTLWFAVFCVGIVTVLSVLLSYRITRPLIELKQAMSRAEQGNFNRRVTMLSNDEFGQLGRGFNKMMEEINRLFHEVFVLGMREKEAELSALQSQINPHFIYNTLESINMMAIQRKHAEVSDMVTALGKLLRYTIDKVDRQIQLREEIHFVDSYVRIQQIRYGGKLQVLYEIEDGVKDCLMPKLILQPLVENAVYHGIDGREEGGTIWISALRFEDELLITVRDNGKGMGETEIEKLNEAICKQPANQSLQLSDQDKLGLNNIFQRIVLMYDKGSSLTVDGSPGQGLAVTITIPL